MIKKNILFIFSRHSENPNDSTLTKDLADEFARQGHGVYVVTMLERKYKRESQLKIENGYLVPFMPGAGLQTRSQDLPPAFVVNGSLYLVPPSDLRSSRSFLGANPIPQLLEPSQQTEDIDTESDFKMAENFARTLKETLDH